MPDLVSVDWPRVRSLAISKLDESPPPDAEDELISLFVASPQIVLVVLDEVARDIANGAKIRSGWRVWRSRAAERAAARSDVSATISDDREKLVERARRWMQTEGMSLETPQAMECALFGIPEQLGSADELTAIRDQLSFEHGGWFDDGVRKMLEVAIDRARAPDAPALTGQPELRPILAAYADERQLRGEMSELWLKLRPVGEQVERDTERRAAEWREQRAVLQARRSRPPADEGRALSMIETYVAQERAKVPDESYFADVPKPAARAAEPAAAAAVGAEQQDA